MFTYYFSKKNAFWNKAKEMYRFIIIIFYNLYFFIKKMPICNIKICLYVLYIKEIWLRSSKLFPYVFIMNCIWVCLLNRVCSLTRFEKRSCPAHLLGSARKRNFLKIPSCHALSLGCACLLIRLEYSTILQFLLLQPLGKWQGNDSSRRTPRN